MKYKLDELFDLQMGKTPSRNNLEYWNTRDNKWISIADLSKCEKYIVDTKEYISDLAVKESGIGQIPANTVIMSFKLSIGKTAITKEPIYSNEAIMSFRDKKVTQLIPDYIYYLVLSKDWNEGTNKAVMGKTLNKATLSKTTINIHNITEQEHIVSVLDEVESVISKRKQQLEKLDELIKARFVEMFGDVIHNSKQWNTYMFSDITTSRLGKMLDSKQQTGRSSYPYLANSNVQWLSFDLDNLKQMDFNEKDQKEYELKDGDLLVCEGGEIGRCAIWHNYVVPCYFQKALHRVRCNKEFVIPQYLAWWFKYNCDNKGFSEIEGAKVTIAHMPSAKLKKLNVVVPPIDLQNQFAAFVAQVDKSKVVVQKALNKSQVLFDSLMQKYFG